MFAAGKTKGVVATAANYIEDVFSTYLYTGTGATQTITNNIDLSTYGGLTWSKRRDSATGGNHVLIDTVRGAGNYIGSNTTSAQATDAQTITAFGTTGYSIGTSTRNNTSAATYASWTFRKQPKFFDVVTYTGDGTAGRTIAHNLGSVPGCIIVKCTNTAGADWAVYHRGITDPALYLNDTSANTASNSKYFWGNDTVSIAPTSTVFTVGGSTAGALVNGSGNTYVAYLFAHDAGGFGLTGTDNVISCGSFTTGTNRNFSVNLGYEPQWLLVKRTNSAEDWYLLDVMRGFSMTGDTYLIPNLSDAEIFGTSPYLVNPTATGFQQTGSSGAFNGTYIYIAIRRGPMKVPTDATKVLALSTWTGSTGDKALGSQTANFGTGFATFIKGRNYGQDWGQFDQLRGVRPFLSSTLTSAEINDGSSTGGISVVAGNQLQLNSGSYFGGGGDGTGYNYIGYNFRRAPSFFDEVCYTGTGSGTPNVLSHNLGVTPELIIGKNRSIGSNWLVYSSTLGATKALLLNDTSASFTQASVWNSTNPTSTTVTLGGASQINDSGQNGVLYLFATCAGVSKVGSYTGTGTTLQVNCGFTGGARFVLIKRTDSTGDWYVYDTARGMTLLTDPYLLLNSTAAESATLGSVTTVSTGFAVNASILAAINTNGASYIFLAIA